MYKIRLAGHLSTDELERRYRHAKEPTERSWWQIRWLLSQGWTGKAVAASTGYSAYWIGQLARRYNTEGPEGMVKRQRTLSRRTPTLLTSAQIEALREALAGPAPHGERWTSRTVAEWMSERLGRPVRKQRGGDDLQRFKARQRLPRPRHVQADPAEQDAFQKGSGRSSVKSLTPCPPPTSSSGPPMSTAAASSPS